MARVFGIVKLNMWAMIMNGTLLSWPPMDNEWTNDPTRPTSEIISHQQNWINHKCAPATWG